MSCVGGDEDGVKAEGTFMSGPGPLRENCHLPELGGQQLVSPEHEPMEPKHLWVDRGSQMGL